MDITKPALEDLKKIIKLTELYFIDFRSYAEKLVFFYTNSDIVFESGNPEEIFTTLEDLRHHCVTAYEESSFLLKSIMTGEYDDSIIKEAEALLKQYTDLSINCKIYSKYVPPAEKVNLHVH